MNKRHSRRSTRPILDLPSLFGSESESDRLPSSHLSGGGVPDNSDPANGIGSEFVVAEEFTRPRRRLRFISFGSGSSGNCAYIGTPECGFLIDAGVDNNRVVEQLKANGIDIDSIRGILLTHDHADHVRYCYALVRRRPNMLLYATNRTIEGMLRRHNISRRITDYHSAMFKEHEYHFGDIRIIPFETSHDGTDNVGFAIYYHDNVFVVATDMGYVTERADFYIRQATALMIESNYDSEMLTRGRYPEYLKARIRSAKGHMDNSETSSYLTKIYTPKLNHVFLCHLSEDNNTPETATASMLNALRTIGVTPTVAGREPDDKSVVLQPLPRFDSSELFILG